MFLFCSRRVKRAVQGIEQAARCLFAAPFNESAGPARVGRVTATQSRRRERKQYPALNAYSGSKVAWVLLSRKDPWC
jgi:hypothetical protein